MALVVVGTLAGAVLVGLLLWRVKVRLDERRRTSVLEAAMHGDRERLGKIAGSRVSIDVRDREGSTALHGAYYNLKEEAVDALAEFGADETIRNKLGLLPAQMARLGYAEARVCRLAGQVRDWGDWVDPGAARDDYLRLCNLDETIYNLALVRAVTHRKAEVRGVLVVAIKVGRSASLDRLVQLLDGYGDKQMAEDYINCCCERLVHAGYRWARRNNYTVRPSATSGVAEWGTFY